MEIMKGSVVTKEEGRGRDGGFPRQLKLFCIIMFDTHHYTFVMEYKIPIVIPTDYGLWVISGLIDDNKFTPLIHSVDSGGDYACVGTGGIWELSVLFAQFCYETKKLL